MLFSTSLSGQSVNKNSLPARRSSARARQQESERDALAVAQQRHLAAKQSQPTFLTCRFAAKAHQDRCGSRAIARREAGTDRERSRRKRVASEIARSLGRRSERRQDCFAPSGDEQSGCRRVGHARTVHVRR